MNEPSEKGFKAEPDNPCIECGEREGLYPHPDWPADKICALCHVGEWDAWIESKIQEYLLAVEDSGEYSKNLKEL